MWTEDWQSVEEKSRWDANMAAIKRKTEREERQKQEDLDNRKKLYDELKNEFGN